MRLRWGIRTRLRARGRRLVRELIRAWARRYRRTYATRLDRVTTREELPALLNARGLAGVGVEVGVKEGVFSAHLLRHWRGQRLISVDSWAGKRAHHFSEAKDRLAPFGERSQIWHMTSLEAAASAGEGSLDFVYIDAAHDTESVRLDLEAWFPKVRVGGIMAGHDYIPDRKGFGVKSAVDEFFGARGMAIETTSGVRSVEINPSWIVEV